MLGALYSGIVYFLEQRSRYETLARDIFRRIESGELQDLLANLVFAEPPVPLYRRKNSQAAKGLVDLLSNFQNLAVVSGSMAVMIEASRLRAAYDLLTPDAIHAATAFKSGADGILTNDKRFSLLAAEGLRLWLFDDLILEDSTEMMSRELMHELLKQGPNRAILALVKCLNAQQQGTRHIARQPSPSP